MDIGIQRFQLEQAAAFDFIVAMVLDTARCLRHPIIVGHHHAAFAARTENLVVAEAECSDVPEGTGTASLVLGAMCLGGVLDDHQVVLRRQGHARIHIRRVPGQMNRDNRTCALVQVFADRFDADVLCLQIDIGEHGDGLLVQHRKRSGDEGAARHDDLVARSHVGGRQCHVQRRRPVHHGNAVLHTAECREPLLEVHPATARPVIHPALAQDVFDGVDLLVREVRPRRKRPAADFLTPIDCQLLVGICHHSKSRTVGLPGG